MQKSPNLVWESHWHTIKACCFTLISSICWNVFLVKFWSCLPQSILHSLYTETNCLSTMYTLKMSVAEFFFLPATAMLTCSAQTVMSEALVASTNASRKTVWALEPSHALLIGHVNYNPTMQFFTGFSRNTPTELVWDPKIKHCGILIDMPYRFSENNDHTHLSMKQVVTRKLLVLFSTEPIMTYSTVFSCRWWCAHQCSG